MHSFTLIRIAFFCLLYLIILTNTAQGKMYYVSSIGNDTNDGLTIHTPWKSINKINESSFLPGDIVLFEGNNVFYGTINITEKHSGTPGNPFVLKSYGNGKAIIHGGYENAIVVRNVEYFEIRDLEITANGRYNNRGSGIHIMTNRTDKMLPGVIIDNVNVHGFYYSGIGVGAEPTTLMGFENLKITNCNVYENGFSGIETWGAWDDITGKSAFNHKGLYIGYTRAFKNHGLSTYTTNWTGTGILMAGVENGLIEYSEAYDNGKENGCSGGGPVGIWLANAKGCIIQFCESYNNKAGKRKDGGGFDIDGGSQYCIIQYCYSHDNEGPGYALFEWGNKNRFTNNIIRYNISQNDARRNGYGAISFWSGNDKLYNCEVYNNTIYLSDSAIVSGIPSALRFSNKSMSKLKIRNNIFFVSKGVMMLDAPLFDTTVALFQNNNYYSTSNKPTFYFGGSYYYSLEDWKTGAKGQEMKGNNSIGFSKDPLFINPGGGKIIKPSEGGDLTHMTAYMIQPGSDMIDAGLNLKDEFGIDIGQRDYYNNKILEGHNFDIGANEFNPQKFIVMPLKYLSFSVEFRNNNLIYNWEVANPEINKYFFLEISIDGIHFQTTKIVLADNNKKNDKYQEVVNGVGKEGNYFRVSGMDKLGNTIVSNIIKLPFKQFEKPILFPVPAKENMNVQLPLSSNYIELIITDALSVPVLRKNINNKSLLSLDIKSLKSGIYFMEFYRDGAQKESMQFIKF